MKPKAKNIARRGLLVVLGIMLGINIYALNAMNVAGNQMPMPFNVGLTTVESNSMQPTYNKGDLLVVHAQPQYETGDVVVYQTQNSLVVHRIISVVGETITTQGDANNTPDAPFDVSCIKGKVVAGVPALGLVISFMKTPLGILVILALAVLLIEFSFRRQRQATHSKQEVQKRVLREEIEQLKRELGE